MPFVHLKKTRKAQNSSCHHYTSLGFLTEFRERVKRCGEHGTLQKKMGSFETRLATFLASLTEGRRCGGMTDDGVFYVTDLCFSCVVWKLRDG